MTGNVLLLQLKEGKFMKKIVLAGLLAASSLVMADVYSPFIGAGAIMSRIETGDGVQHGHKKGFDLRAGFTAEKNRIYLTYDNVDSDLHTLSLAALNAEGVTLPYQFSGWLATRFFIGVHLGASEFNNDYGAAGGAQGGIIFDFPAGFSLEFGGKYTLSEEDEINNIETVYSAFNYRF
jgi:hypothetical protein